MGVLRSSSFPRRLLPYLTCATHPKVHIKLTVDLVLCHTSCGVLPVMLWVGAQFWMNTAVTTSSPHSYGLEFHTMEFESERVVGMSAPSPTTPGPEPATPAPGASPLAQHKFVSPPSNAEECMDADASDVEPRYHTVNSILSVASPLCLTAH
jgi:hypothetical protein